MSEASFHPPSPQGPCAMTFTTLRSLTARHLHLHDISRLRDGQASDMLRYRPSLELSPTSMPSQSTTLVPHKPQDRSIVQQPLNHDKQDQILVQSKQYIRGSQNCLQSLLDFARSANDRERASVTLGSFLRQVQERRTAIESTLQDQTSIAVMSVLEGLLHLVPTGPFIASDDFYEDLNPGLQMKEAKRAISTDRSTAPKDKTSETMQVTRRHELPSSTTSVDSPCLTTSQKPTVRSDEGPKGTHQDTTKIRLKQEVTGPPNGPTQQHSYEVSHVPTGTRRLFLRSQIATVTGSSDVISLDDPKDLQKDVQAGIGALALTAKEGERYGAELFLHPISARPRTKQRVRVFPEAQYGSFENWQTQTADYETMGLSTDAVKVKLPASILTSPAITGSHHVSTHQEVSGPYEHFKAVVNASPAVDGGLRMQEGVQNAGPINTNKFPLGEAVGKIPNARADLCDASIKGKALQMMVRKKKASVQSGPDHFLGLLELVRKK